MTAEDLVCSVFDTRGAFLMAPLTPDEPTIYMFLSRNIRDIWIRLHPDMEGIQTHMGVCT